jgi:TonB-linked SusC/RagA family outer membrane protein
MKKLFLLIDLFVFISGYTLLAQTIVITGTVTSSVQGEGAIPGVTVTVKGTTFGAVTDINGKYSVTSPTTGTTLVFSYIGMKKQEIEIGGRKVIDVIMEPELMGLNEVVVTALGIKRDTKALGYSVSEVKSDEIAQSNTTDVVNALNSKVAGVRINNSSGAAGSAAYITIRGAKSITGNNQPLFVVDGTPIFSGGGEGSVQDVAYSNRTIDINPEDIESMTVLKGGAATALYGLRAANGVIVITTKKGKATTGNKIDVSYTSAVTISQISQTLPLQNKYSQGTGGKWAEGNRYSWGAMVDTLYYYKPPAWQNQQYQWNPDGWLRGQHQAGVDPAYLTNEKAKTFDQYDFFQKGVAYNNALTLSGGNEHTTFYFSAANWSEKGVVPDNTFDKTNLKFSVDAKLGKNKNITTGASFNYIISGGNRIQQGSNISGVMLGLIRTAPTFNDAAGYIFPDGTQRNYRGSGTTPGPYDNPYWTAYRNSYKDKVDRGIADFHFDWTINKWVNLTYRLGTDFYTTQVTNRFAIGSNNAPEGYLGQSDSFNQSVNSDLLIYFKKDLGDKFKTNLMLGNNMYEYNYGGLNGYANNLNIPDFYQLSNTSNQTTSAGVQKYRTAAFLGELDIQYADMLFLTGTGRNDWSTTMPESNLSEFYPSGSVGFVFTELPFLKGNKILPFGKLRASYAITANIAGPYNTQSYYTQAGAADGWTTGLAFPLLGNAGFAVGGQLGNQHLKHEKQASFEVGTDLRFLNDRFTVDIAYFKNENTDLLLSVPIANSTGFSSLYQNAASMESKGIELLGTIVPVRISGFEWALSVNFSQYDNKVKKLAPNVDNVFLGGFTNPQVRAVAGQDYPTLYGYDWWRDTKGNLVLNDDPTSPYYGYPMGNYTLVPLGKVTPDWTMGITNTFSYKGFKIIALLEIKKGGLMWNGTLGAAEFHGTSGDTQTRNDPHYWKGVLGHIEQDANGKDIVVVTNESPAPINAPLNESWYRLGEGSSFTGPTISSIQKTDWTRLREVTASYTFPKSLMGKTFINSLEIYFTGRNLFLKTPYTGIDPETNLLGSSNAQGFDYFNMPGTKSYSFGLRVTF